MNPTLARIPVPFRWNVHDGLNGASLIARAYSSEVAGVLTRTSPKRVSDRNGLLVPLVQGIPPIGWVGGEAGLLLERAGTNLFIQSDDAAAWTNYNTCTVTTNVRIGPSGAVNADRLTATATGSARGNTVAFVGDGEKSVAGYLYAGTSARSQVEVIDTTAAVTRHLVSVNWSAGVPSLATAAGAGTLYAMEPLGTTGWYRILFSATGIVAANTNVVRCYPDVLSGTGTVDVGGFQAGDAAVPSSYIPTTTVAVTRAADGLYFPFTLPPTAMTVFVRGLERGTIRGGTETRLLAMTAAPLATAAIRIDVNAGFYRVRNNQLAGGVQSDTTVAPTVGQSVELRATLASTGAVRMHQSITGGAETSGAASGASALDPAWSGQFLHLGGVAGLNGGIFAFTHVCVALGEQPLDVMRELAGV